MTTKNCAPAHRAAIDEIFPHFARRAAPYFQIIESQESFNTNTRESFSKALADALEQLRLAIIKDPYAPNMIGNATSFQNIPSVDGPGRVV